MLASMRTRLAAGAVRVARPRVLGAVAGAGVATAAAAYNSTVFASDGVLAPTLMPWDFGGYFTTYDAAAIRRGHQVYSQVCASCHGLRAIAYRNLVDVCYSEEEAKALAEDIEVSDGPNDEGEMFDRPGKLSDYMPSPYPNEEAARFANNGAYPPDLSLITKVWHTHTQLQPPRRARCATPPRPAVALVSRNPTSDVRRASAALTTSLHCSPATRTCLLACRQLAARRVIHGRYAPL